MKVRPGLVGPYSANITRLATIVGSANGRSMTESTSRLPGKSSRVSTHATSKPNTRLITVTPIETVSVTRNDSNAALDVIAAQNAAHPPPAACHTIAASGSSTMTASQIDRRARRAALSCRTAGRTVRAPAEGPPVAVGEFGPGRLRIEVDCCCHPVACL